MSDENIYNAEGNIDVIATLRHALRPGGPVQAASLAQAEARGHLAQLKADESLSSAGMGVVSTWIDDAYSALTSPEATAAIEAVPEPIRTALKEAILGLRVADSVLNHVGL